MSAPVTLTHEEWLTWCLWTNSANAAQIAYSLGVTENTVRTYILRIGRKTGANGRIAMSRLEVAHAPRRARRGKPATVHSRAGLDMSHGNVGQSVPSG